MEENLPNANQNTNTPPEKVVPTDNPQPQPTPEAVAEQPSPKRKPSAIKIIMFIIILFLLGALGYFVYQNNQLKSQLAYKPIATPAPSLEPTPTPNPTANWNLYTNTAFNYSIKYPLTFLTQNMSAGAGTSEALPTSTHLYIYDTEDEEHYLNRYVNIEHLGLIIPKSNGYNETNTTVGNKSAIKYTSTDPEVLFDIYVINFGNDQGGLEIYVSKSEDKQKIADQILSTFKYREIETSQPGWNSYTNKRYEYTVEYPKEWYLNKESGGHGSMDTIYSYEPKDYFDIPLTEFFKTRSKIELTRSIVPKATTETLDEWIKKQDNLSNYKTISEEKVIIGDYPAIKWIVTFPNEELGKGTVFYIDKGNLIYFINVAGYEANKELIDQILTTFKFLE